MVDQYEEFPKYLQDDYQYENSGGDGGRPKSHYVIAAVGLVLLVVVAANVFSGGDKEIKPAPPIASTPEKTVSSKRTVETKVDEITPTTQFNEPEVKALINAGLGEWASFAGDGELKLLGKLFAKSGPQYKKFERDAKLADGKHYSFISRSTSLELKSPTKVVANITLEVSVDESPIQEAKWKFEIRHMDGRWVIWSVDLAG